MQRPIPLSTLLRFPLLFGSLVIAGGTAFYYREMFMGDIIAQRSALTRENPEDRKIIEQKIKDMKMK